MMSTWEYCVIEQRYVQQRLQYYGKFVPPHLFIDYITAGTSEDWGICLTPDLARDLVNDALAYLGKEGWELTSVEGTRYYLKRQQ